MPIESAHIEKQLQKLLEYGKICSSTSLVLIVPNKEQNEWIFCTGYRVLKKITLKNWYSLPKIDGLID